MSKEIKEPKCKTCGDSGIKKPEEGCGKCLSIDGNCRADCPCPACQSPEQPNCEGCEFFKHTHSNEHCYRYTEEPSLCKLRQEPVEQPPAGEFTEKVREDWDKNIFGGVIFDLCYRLDRSEASREALLTALKRISDIEDERYTHCGFDLEVNNISKAAIAKEKEVKI